MLNWLLAMLQPVVVDNFQEAITGSKAVLVNFVEITGSRISTLQLKKGILAHSSLALELAFRVLVQRFVLVS
jgi:hypothetical protein